MTKAVILLSGGIDSTVVLALAKSQGIDCFALSFNYGQRHIAELGRAKKIAAYYQVPHQVIFIDPHSFQGSSLTGTLQAPINRSFKQMQDEGIPNTYVPARNTLFLAYALGHCENLNADEIHFGPNKTDARGYPDCRPEYLQAFEKLMQLATKQAVSGQKLRLVTPLLNLGKDEIIHLGLKLKAPLDQTLSCYCPLPDETPCRQCDACLLRQKGFEEAL